jgi:hypothetical protein
LFAFFNRLLTIQVAVLLRKKAEEEGHERKGWLSAYRLVPQQLFLPLIVLFFLR